MNAAAFDRVFLERCGKVVVLTLDGWRDSVGVQRELEIAREMDKLVGYLPAKEVVGSPTTTPVTTRRARGRLGRHQLRSPLRGKLSDLGRGGSGCIFSMIGTTFAD